MRNQSHLVTVLLCLLTTKLMLMSSIGISQNITPTYDKITHDFVVSNIAISEDKKLILTTDLDGNYTVRDLETGKSIAHGIEDCVIYNSYFGQNDYEINLITHSNTKSSIKKINYNTSQIIDELIIPNIPDIENIRSTISPDKQFIVFDNYKKNIYYSPTSNPTKYLLVYNTKSGTTNELKIEEDVSNVFPFFDKDNNLTINYKIDNDSIEAKEITKVYDPQSGTEVAYKIPIETKSIIYSLHLAKEKNYEVGYASVLSPSPNGKLLAIGGGEDLVMTAIGGSNARIQSSGFVKLWDVDEVSPGTFDIIVHHLNMKVEDIVWVDDYHFIATDITGNLHYYNITKATPEKQVIKPQKSSTSLDISSDFNKIIFSSDNNITGIFNLSEPDPLKIIDTLFNRYSRLSESDNFLISEAYIFDTYPSSTNPKLTIGDNKIDRYPSIQDISNTEISTDGQVAAYSSTILTNSHWPANPVSEDDFVLDQTGQILGYHRDGMMVYNEELSLSDNYNSTTYDPQSHDGIQMVNLNFDNESYILESKGRGHDIQLSNSGNYISTSRTHLESMSLFNNVNKRWKYFNIGNAISENVSIKANFFDKNSPLSITILENEHTVIWHTKTDEILYILNDQNLNKELTDACIHRNISIDERNNRILYIYNNVVKSYNYNKTSTEIITNLPIDSRIDRAVFSEYSDYLCVEHTTSSQDYGISKPQTIKQIIDLNTKTNVYYRQLINSTQTTGYYSQGLSNTCYFHNTKKLAYLYDGNGELELYDLDKQKTLATVIFFANGDWLVYTPEGLFDANKNGRQSFYYTMNNEIILYEQIKERFWETDLLNKIINGQVDNPITNLGLPLYPQSTINLSEESGKISVQLKERSGGIGKVNLLINNTLRVEDINPERKSQFSYDLTNVERYLFPKGINEISIRTYNKDGWINSRNNSIHIETDLEALKAGQKGFSKTEQVYRDSIDLTPGLFGLFVGTSVYKDPKLNLNFSDDDAIALMDGFQKIGADMYDSDRMDLQLLTSGSSSDEKKSSKKNIIAALENIAEHALPHDIIVLFLSGHGMTIDEDFYYLTSDAGTVDLYQDIESRNTVCVSSKELLENLKKIRSNKQVIVLDACHSGQITQILSGSTKALSTTQEKALEFLEDKMGVYILASSESNQKSFETEALEKGLLTFGLLRGMSGGASKNGVINVIDLLNYASNEAEDIGKRVLNRTQRPVLNIAKGGSSFPIGFENADLKVSLPKNKIAIGESFIKKTLLQNIFHDPQKINTELASLLKERGAYGASATFVYTKNEDENTYTINGTYDIKNDDITIEWYILKNEEIFAGPFTKSKSINKKTKLINIIISRSIETINTSQ